MDAVIALPDMDVCPAEPRLDVRSGHEYRSIGAARDVAAEDTRLQRTSRARRWMEGAAWLLPMVAMAIVYPWVLPPKVIGDEHEHLNEVVHFTFGNFSQNQGLTMFPGYHALLMVPAWITHRYALEDVRLYTFVLSLCAVGMFVACSRLLTPDRAAPRAWQWTLFPILTPYFFVIYTDVTSLLFILLALYATLRSRHGWAVLFGVASLAVRQTNILWMVFFGALAWLDTGRATASDANPSGTAGWRDHARHLLPTRTDRPRRWGLWSAYALVACAFAAFVTWNGGVAMSDRGSHPFPSVHVSNVYFLLFLHAVFFLPTHVRNAPAIGAMVARRPWILALVALALPVFLATFTNTHEYNRADGAHGWFLRNRLLALLTDPPSHVALAYVPIAYAVLSLCVTPLVRREYAIFYPITVVFLLPSWLVEQRYYLIPFTLFLLTRARSSERAEVTDAVWMLPFTGYVLWGIAHGQFFL